MEGWEQVLECGAVDYNLEVKEGWLEENRVVDVNRSMAWGEARKWREGEGIENR